MTNGESMEHKRKGFTLTELLMASIIFGFFLSVLLYAFLGCITLNETSRNLTKATQHAQFVLEDIRNAAFANISTNITNGTWNLDSSEITTQGLSPLKLENITVTSSGTTVLDVTVTVTWNDVQQRSRTLTLKTSIANV